MKVFVCVCVQESQACLYKETTERIIIWTQWRNKDPKQKIIIHHTLSFFDILHWHDGGGGKTGVIFIPSLRGGGRKTQLKWLQIPGHARGGTTDYRFCSRVSHYILKTRSENPYEDNGTNGAIFTVASRNRAKNMPMALFRLISA